MIFALYVRCSTSAHQQIEFLGRWPCCRQAIGSFANAYITFSVAMLLTTLHLLASACVWQVQAHRRPYLRRLRGDAHGVVACRPVAGYSGARLYWALCNSVPDASRCTLDWASSGASKAASARKHKTCTSFRALQVVHITRNCTKLLCYKAGSPCAMHRQHEAMLFRPLWHQCLHMPAHDESTCTRRTMSVHW
jgi:hypothetical protein